MGRRKEKSNYWGAFILDWFKYLQDADLRGTDYRVLFYLTEIMKADDNVAYIKQKEIAEELSLDKGNISKSIKRLCNKQFMIKCSNGFMINPHLFYIGNSNQRYNLRDTFDQNLRDKNLIPRFSLNEDDRVLEATDDEEEYYFN
ncbi:replication/maintenance protein RepL [Rossellomorea marisflavi]|uniref:replication/maintenance protein RepL n=1 Tax=Rossellomorea marisflavi TaxID=189381 RepID=UPI00345C8250